MTTADRTGTSDAMTHPPATVRRAEPGDALVIAELLAEAFLHGDLAPWLIPHPGTRARIYPPYFALLAEHALTHGEVETTRDNTAVAVWYQIDDGPLPELPGYRQRLAEITGEFLPRFAALDEAMHAHHPYGQPHHYLAFLAVHPDRQRQGLGTALLNHHHADLHAAGISAYLEATSTRNSRLYARHGYRPRPVYRIAGDGPSLFPMWRSPPGPTTHR
ncbi:GNAT family N-acetyltransferase [Actinoplanes regularis]|uniref:Acetyltransferase (GNAT) domain-containing protein n=1 Tax=Actinoplanes regularis TaxID=52697 RepID=A0A239IZA3_9ACTN|nr:GNAT family N-acetyltransferase [Actinoplanes regularis]GIE91597.1 GCN5 family N-acetyltransferase [Actinoplanes regularis]SNS97744.1 Acetyltransferase (GNAT) domain-containing protein [Actinoplanes regularis]